MSSVLEELRTVERHLVSRMNELRPLVAEFQELERIAERLGLDATEPAAPPEPTSRKSQAKSPAVRKAAAARRARPKAKSATKPNATESSATERVGTREIGAQRREQVLNLIRERPGITVPDISGELGVDAPPLYRVVRKLQADALITKEGKELRLA